MATTLEDNGKKTGELLLEKYGPDHFKKMGQRSIAKQVANDPDLLSKRGKNGALARAKKDPKYLEKMRAKRWGKKVQKSALDILLGK